MSADRDILNSDRPSAPLQATMSNEQQAGMAMAGGSPTQTPPTQQSVSYTPKSGAGVASSEEKQPPIVCGMIPGISKDIPDEYRITITRQRGRNEKSPIDFMVYGFIQEVVQVNLKSSWDTFNPLEIKAGQVANYAAQLFSGMSFATRWSSRRIWRGTTPLQLAVTMKFESITDTYNNVLLPCILLQKLSLPTYGFDIGGKATKAFTFLTPPGPSPFAPLDFGRGENIRIQMGKFLVVPNAVIYNIDTQFSTARLDRQGRPLGATITLIFQSYEILTKDTLVDLYTVAKEQK